MKLKMNRSKTLILCAVSVIAVTVSIPSAQAGHAGAFLGGIAVARVGSNMRDRRDYEEDQTYYAQQQAQSAQSQANSKPTTEEQLAQLQKLAAKGYITPEEYKAKKKAILDDM
jgi:membrane protease subunit (stomatin/prohibitin family)